MSNAAEPVGNKETAETTHLEGASTLPDGKDILPRHISHVLALGQRFSN